MIEAVEVSTDDTKYLVKISAKLEKTMANYEEEDYDDFRNEDSDEMPDIEIEESEESEL